MLKKQNLNLSEFDWENPQHPSSYLGDLRHRRRRMLPSGRCTNRFRHVRLDMTTEQKYMDRIDVTAAFDGKW